MAETLLAIRSLKNSIHDNALRGIASTGTTTLSVVPALFDFDLQAGTPVGAACAGCVVEVFSDAGDEGSDLRRAGRGG